MSRTLRTAHPVSDPKAGALIDAIFERPARESRLVAELARGYPDFDPGISIIVEDEGESCGYGLFLPRRFQLRGMPVRLAISSPVGALPEARKRGVGGFLIQAGQQALRDRQLRGAVVLGLPEFFVRHGYHSAFNLYTLQVQRADLPEHASDGWRGLTADDLPLLAGLQQSAYEGVSGTEVRSLAPLDWESSARASYTLVLEHKRRPIAYLRFRVRKELEVRECGLASAEALASVLGFLKRLMQEHGRERMEVHLPPPHPLARALFHLGARLEASNFRGGAMLCVLDWVGLLNDTAKSWSWPLSCFPGGLSLDLEGQELKLDLDGSALKIGKGRNPKRHLFVPRTWGAGLITGQRCARDLALDEQVQAKSKLDERGWELVRALFPSGTPMWTYSPVFEIADD